MTAKDAQFERNCWCQRETSPCQGCHIYAKQVIWYRKIKRLMTHDPWTDPVPPPPEVERLYSPSAQLRRLLEAKIPLVEPLTRSSRRLYKDMTPQEALETLASTNPYVAPWVTRWARHMSTMADWRIRIGLELKGENCD